jgi:hypothetical protein
VTYHQLAATIPTRWVSARERETLHPFAFFWESRWREIPAGFRWDGASIPNILHWWERPWADWLVIPSLVHDYLYRYRIGTRYSADRAFLAAMCWQVRHSGRSRHWQARKMWRARVCYRAVRTFGGAWW